MQNDGTSRTETKGTADWEHQQQDENSDNKYRMLNKAAIFHNTTAVLELELVCSA
jgi:hypothetical protein